MNKTTEQDDGTKEAQALKDWMERATYEQIWEHPAFNSDHQELAFCVPSKPTPHHRDPKDDAEGEANARLIAAAPELLKACRKAYEAIGKATDGQLLTTYNELKLTINKATKG